MTDHRPHLDPNLSDDLTPGARLRAIADGELAGDNLNDTDRARIDFEKELRARVARAMSGVELPADLRARIESAYQRESGVVRPAFGDTRSPSFWQRYSGILSAAAVIALCAALVGLSFVRSNPNQTPIAGITLPIAQIASFVHGQHEACDPSLEATMIKFHARTQEEVIDYTSGRLGEAPPILRERLHALDAIGYRFMGVGGCGVPGEGPSVHAIYIRDASPNPDQGCQKVSLFVQKIIGECGLEKTECMLARCAETKKQTLAVWRQNGFVYYLYCPDEETRAAAQRAFGAPESIFEYPPS